MADAILAEGFKSSLNDYDWLGHGFYFFERAPRRAAEWAATHFGKDACVVEASVSLERCLDLTDIQGIDMLRPYYDMFADTFGAAALRRLRSGPGARRLDCAVINFACAALQEEGRPVHVVRAAFQEGSPIWGSPNSDVRSSFIFDRSHVQLSVRNVAALGDICVHATSE